MSQNLKTLGWIVAVAALCQGLAWILPPYASTLLLLMGINALMAVSLNIVNGLSGQFSLGHAGFMAVGGYTAASVNTFLLSSWQGSTGSQQGALLVSLAVGALAAAFVGFLVGLPSLRLRGDYLAIVTLGFGEIIRVVLLNIPEVGGARGMIGIPQTTTAFLVFLSLVSAVLAIHRWVLSHQGRAVLSIREDEIAASCLGVDVTGYKVKAFVVSAALAGWAGGLFAHDLSYLNPSEFGFMKSVELVIMVVLGGLGSISGSVVAAFLLTLLPEALRPLQELTGIDLRMVIYSLVLIGMMLIRPGGLFGRRELWQMFGKKNPKPGTPS